MLERVREVEDSGDEAKLAEEEPGAVGGGGSADRSANEFPPLPSGIWGFGGDGKEVVVGPRWQRERERSGEVGSAGQGRRGQGRRRHGSLAIWETREETGEGKGGINGGRKEGEG